MYYSLAFVFTHCKSQWVIYVSGLSITIVIASLPFVYHLFLVMRFR